MHSGIETRFDARQMSRPVPSPSMNGMIGLAGVTGLLSFESYFFRLEELLAHWKLFFNYVSHFQIP